MSEHHLRPPSRRELAVLRLRNPSDILSAIPFLLRFHPEDSFVFLVLNQERLVLTARVDIGEEPIDARAVGDYFARICHEHGGDGIIMAAYTDRPARLSTVVDDVVRALHPVVVHEALVTDGHRWWSRCAEADSPAEGVPFDVTTTEVAARAVAAGLPTLPNRAALRDSVAGPRGAAVAVATDAFEEVLPELADLPMQARRDRMFLLVEGFCVHRRPLTPRECAELAVLAYDGDARDVAAARITAEDAEVHVALWHQVVAGTLAPFEMAPLCLLGLAAWVSGNGALQVVCMERAEQINPDYSLLQVLEQINACCVPPSAWERLRTAA